MKNLTVILDPMFGSNTPKKASPVFPDDFAVQSYQGSDRFYAYSWTREIAVQIKEKLASRGVSAVLTVDSQSDWKVDPGVAAKRETIQDVLKTGDAIVVIISANSMNDGEWHLNSGWECCISSVSDVKSKSLGAKFTEQYQKSVISEEHELRKGSLGFLLVKANMPSYSDLGVASVLTNNFFYDNKEELLFMMSDYCKNQVVSLHVESIMQYLQDESVITEAPGSPVQVQSATAPAESTAEAVASVWEDNSSNKYSAVDVSAGNVEAEHTRIYQYFPPEIQLDEMSMPLDGVFGQDNTIDPSTGQHKTEYMNVNGKDYNTTGVHSPDPMMSIGSVYPLLRINDSYYTHASIKKFTMETVGFMPVIKALISTTTGILKENLIKDGDICSVFINQSHGMLKSYRGDYLITYSVVFDQNTKDKYKAVDIYIEGELYVPQLYNAGLTFSYTGTSKDALIDAAKRLGLGFNFCDPDNTNDYQIWHCIASGKMQKGGDSPALNYLKSVSKHAWKEFESFYDCWVDPRYAVSFINVAKMLGGQGLDEAIDLAFFNTAVLQNIQLDGENANLTDEQKKANPKMQAKILSNIMTDTEALTAFYVLSAGEINNSGNITKQLGLNVKNCYNIKNPGLTDADSSVEMDLSIPVNEDKLANGFYVLGGPGVNTTYKQADNGSFVEQHKSVRSGFIANTMSDADVQSLKSGKGNMRSSGNTNKFFEVGEGHNMLNNMWLTKKIIKMTLNGCNLLIMRGEKIPALIMDSAAGLNIIGQNKTNVVSKRVIENQSGWFVIKAIKWVYDATKAPEEGTAWTTEVQLTRREWPVIGYNKEQIDHSEIVVTNDIGAASFIEALNSFSEAMSSEGETEYSEGETTTQGLKDYMVLVYNDIVQALQAVNGKVKLISGKRWFVDSDGNKTEDKSKAVQDGGLYKFMNAIGGIVWFSDSDSPHITGNAFDIINDKGTAFNLIIKTVAADKQTLKDMFTEDIYCAIETTKDDLGQTVKHYHIAKVDHNNTEQVSVYKAWWDVVVKEIGSTFDYEGTTYNIQNKIGTTDNSMAANEKMNESVGLSEAMFNQICKYETGKSFGYKMQQKDLVGYDLGDAGGHLTYGYGLLYHPNNKFMDQVKKVWTQKELEDIYILSAKKFVNGVTSWAKSKNVNLNQFQIDAIVCASYNFGLGFLKKNVCTLIALNPNNPKIKEEWYHLSDKQGVKYPGLITRRKFEADWYFKG